MVQSDQYLQHFAFTPLPGGHAFDVRYWHDTRTAATRTPDYEWQLTIP